MRLPSIQALITVGLLAIVVVVLTAPLGETAPAPRPVPASVAAAAWKAVAASGPVESRRTFEDPVAWQPVRRGDRFEPPALVRTGEKGRATLARGENILMVDPNSLVELPSAVVGTGESEIIQGSGSVVYEVDPQLHGDFRVVTPYLVAGVKGTVFLVTVSRSGAAVTVEEGIVQVTFRSGRTLEAGAGESVRVGPEETDEPELIRFRAASREQRRRVDRDTWRRVRREARRLEVATTELRASAFLDAETEPERSRTHLLGANSLEKEADLSLEDLNEQEGELSEDLDHREIRKQQTADAPDPR